ncbi:MAG: protein translocase subunit SecF [Pseudomonadales bacterium]|nr:protein translocase subunit SecF [Pseudomonadales bacterium]
MSENKVINFMAARKLIAIISVCLVLASIGSLAVKGLNFGLDFTGGVLIEVGYEKPADLSVVRNELSDAGFQNFTVVNFGAETDVLIRMQSSDDPRLGDKVLEVLRANNTKVDNRRIDFVGPQVGGELRDQGGIGMLIALLVMMVYIAVRFQHKFSIGAVVALVHDVLITLGVFSFFQLDFDLTVLAAVLAVIGYSLNDTIVVYDRIRENFRDIRRATSLDIVNISLTQTLSRTVFTSLTTLLVLVALFYFGGELIHGFATALIVGIFVGTYSSIYVAANILLQLKIDKQDLMPPARPDVVDDGMP